MRLLGSGDDQAILVVNVHVEIPIEGGPMIASGETCYVAPDPTGFVDIATIGQATAHNADDADWPSIFAD